MWQRMWYSESNRFVGNERLVQLQHLGYSPYCPGPVCTSFLQNGLYLQRAPAQNDDPGIFRNNLWWVCDSANMQEAEVSYHSVSDLDAMTVPNETAVRFANELFAYMQRGDRLDQDPSDELLDSLMKRAYRQIFGIILMNGFITDSQPLLIWLPEAQLAKKAFQCFYVKGFVFSLKS